jgi:hypothetical protein
MTDLLINIGIGASLILSLLLFNHPIQSNKRANIWLGLFVLLLALAYPNISLQRIIASTNNSMLISIFQAFYFLIGPFLYISILQFTSSTLLKIKRIWPHFVIFLIYVLVEISTPGSWWLRS